MDAAAVFSATTIFCIFNLNNHLRRKTPKYLTIFWLVVRDFSDIKEEVKGDKLSCRRVGVLFITFRRLCE